MKFHSVKGRLKLKGWRGGDQRKRTSRLDPSCAWCARWQKHPNASTSYPPCLCYSSSTGLYAVKSLTSMTVLAPASTAPCWWLLSSSCCSSSRLMSTFSTPSETSTLSAQACEETHKTENCLFYFIISFLINVFFLLLFALYVIL